MAKVGSFAVADPATTRLSPEYLVAQPLATFRSDYITKLDKSCPINCFSGALYHLRQSIYMCVPKLK